MRLISVTIRNYRMHRELTVEFDPSRTVIGGPNEAGKTTIVEAVHRALFLRSRASGDVLEEMRSNVHAGHPSVDLVFESGGTVYTVGKQFTGAANALTTLHEAGGPLLRNEDAERKLSQLVGAEPIQGKNAERKLRMQWGHLWVWQGEAHANPILNEDLGESRTRLWDRLGRLEDGGVMQSPADAAVGRSIAETHAKRTKDEGKPRADSPLGRAEASLHAARAEVVAAREVIGVLDDAVAAFSRAEKAIAESEASLAARRAEQERNDERLREAQTLEVRQAEEQAAAKVAATRLATLTDADRQIREYESRIAAIEAQRKPTAERLENAKAIEGAAEERRASAQEQARAGQQEQARIAALADLHRQAEHLEQQRAERSGKATRCGRIAVLRTEANDLQSRLNDLPIVSADDLAAINDLERQRDSSQAQLDAIATRVELLAAGDPVRLGDRHLAIGESETITTDTVLDAGSTRLRIAPGGGTTLAEATRARDEASAALAARFRALAVADAAEARRVQPLRQTLHSSLEAKRAAIQDLGDTDADRELHQLDQEIATLERVLTGELLPGFTPPRGLDEAVAARRAVSERLRDIATACSLASAEETAAEQALGEARQAREAAAEAIRTIDDDLRDARIRVDVMTQEHGHERKEAIVTATRDRTAADERLATTRATLERLQPELLRQTSGRLQRAIEKLQAANQAAVAERMIALDRLRTNGTLDPHDDLARAQAAERVAAATERHAAREARAHALLAHLFAARKAEIEERFVAPLSKRVADYLRCLFGADTTVSVGSSNNEFTSLHVARPGLAGVAIPFDRLSGGTREQVAAAFRLAMAEILARDHDGCLPVVFDDAFVNSDAARVAAVQGMLERAAERGLQVIVLSCNHREYDSLGATIYVLPPA
jgi:chromosome segregation ATPase